MTKSVSPAAHCPPVILSVAGACEAKLPRSRRACPERSRGDPYSLCCRKNASGNSPRALGSSDSIHNLLTVLPLAFQKKSPKGIKTATTDVDLVSRRLKTAREDYEARYGKRTKQ